MLEALLAGKLSREQENMEDILTSIVFGAFRREPNPNGLLRFLLLSTQLAGESPLNPDASPVVGYDAYDFWPEWPARDGIASCEPDVLIKLHTESDTPILLLIEVKYQSGLSSRAEDHPGLITNQLAKEWAHLVHHCGQTYTPWLIFLTSGFTKPWAEVEEAKAELEQRASALVRRHPLNIAWLSWRQLGTLFDNTEQQLSNLYDISRLIRRLKLVYFTGFTDFDHLPDIQYRFKRRGPKFHWQFTPCPSIDWSFHVQ